MRLHVPPQLKPTVEPFLKDSGWAVELVDDGPADLTIVAGGDRSDLCDTDTLYAGGAIYCATAWDLAKKHQLDLLKLGALMNVLGIRICNCSLGCFQ